MIKRSYTKIILITALIILPTLLFAQFIPKEKPQQISKQSKFYWETSFGLQIGSITNIEISPAIGYEPLKNLFTGIGVSYIYYRNNYYQPVYQNHIFGGSAYIRYQVFDRFLIQAEYQLLNYSGYEDLTGDWKRKTAPGYLVGAGYRQWFNNKMYGDIFLLWNLNAVNDYPYTNPILRITFGGFF